MKDYDAVIDNRFGIIHGKRNLFFVKTNKGEDIYGEDKKYLKVFRSLAERTGCMFVVSANKGNTQCDLEAEINEVDQYVGEYDEIYYVGISTGGLIGAQQCWKIERIKNAYLINVPLMVDWHKTKAGAEKFKGECMHFEYGTKDPSFPYVDLIDSIANDRCKHTTFKDDGHVFDESELEFGVYLFITDQMYSINKYRINAYNSKAYETFKEAMNYARTRGHHGRLLYIFGEEGVGKSHLIWGMFNNDDGPYIRTAVDDAEDLNEMNDIDHYPSCEVVMIDDVNQMSENKKQMRILKEAIMMTGIEDDFQSIEDSLVLVLTADDSPEKVFRNKDMVDLIQKGTVVKIG